MTKDQIKPFDPLKPLSVLELMKARSQGTEIAYFVLDDYQAQSAEYTEKMRLGGQVQEVIDAYESASTPKQKYKAESRLCRLVDRISDGKLAIAQGIQNGDKRYIVGVRRDGGYRIPELHVVDNIKPTQLSMIEFDLMFPDKSGSMPRERTPEEREAIKESVGQFYQGVFGIDKDLFRRYVDIVSRFGDGRARGVRKE